MCVWRAILGLKLLNSQLVYRKFKMASLKSILEKIREGDQLASIDLMGAYLPIMIFQEH